MTFYPSLLLKSSAAFGYAEVYRSMA